MLKGKDPPDLASTHLEHHTTHPLPPAPTVGRGQLRTAKPGQDDGQARDLAASDIWDGVVHGVVKQAGGQPGCSNSNHEQSCQLLAPACSPLPCPPPNQCTHCSLHSQVLDQISRSQEPPWGKEREGEKKGGKKRSGQAQVSWEV